MKLKNTVALSINIVFGIIISKTAITKNAGIAGYTNSPGENACNKSGCHATNALNSGGGSVSIKCPTMPNWAYTAGTTYDIRVTVKKAGVSKFGLGFEALLPSGASAGVISAASSTNTKTASATISGNIRVNAVHKQPNNTGTDSVVFTFQWIAPASGSGQVTFYAAGNATNAGNNSSGDFIYTTSQSITELSTVAVKNQNEKEYNINVFPNPVVDYIYIQLPEIKTNALIEIYDISGKLEDVISIANNSINNNLKYATGNLENGLHFIKIAEGHQNFYAKFVVSK